MVKKSFFSVLFGLSLLACMSTQSYADGSARQTSIMRVVAKAAVDGGAEAVKRTLYIIHNPVGAAKNALVASKTVVGGVATVMGETISNVWGYLIEVPEAEPKPEGDEAGEEGEGPSTLLLTAITEAKEVVVDKVYELAATLYDQKEPTYYVIKDKFVDYTENPFAESYLVPNNLLELYKAAIAQGVDEITE